MPFYSLFLPFLLLLLPVPWLGYLLIFLVLVGIKPFFFFFFHNPNSILDAGGLVCKRREGTRYAILGDFSLFSSSSSSLLSPQFTASLLARVACSACGEAQASRNGNFRNTSKHHSAQKVQSRRRTSAPKKKPPKHHPILKLPKKLLLQSRLWRDTQNQKNKKSTKLQENINESIFSKKQKTDEQQQHHHHHPHGTLISWTTDFPSFQTEATTERRIRRPSCSFFLQAFHKNTNKRERNSTATQSCEPSATATAMGQESAPNSLQPKFSPAKFGGALLLILFGSKHFTVRQIILITPFIIFY